MSSKALDVRGADGDLEGPEPVDTERLGTDRGPMQVRSGPGPSRTGWDPGASAIK